ILGIKMAAKYASMVLEMPKRAASAASRRYPTTATQTVRTPTMPTVRPLRWPDCLTSIVVIGPAIGFLKPGRTRYVGFFGEYKRVGFSKVFSQQHAAQKICRQISEPDLTQAP